MRRRALLVGIAAYDHFPYLTGTIEDAFAMRELLQYHGNRDPNFDCHLLLGAPTETIADSETNSQGAHLAYGVTYNRLRSALEELFAFEDMALFYYSGHGYPSEQGRYLVTQDGTGVLPGMLMNDVLELANRSPAREIVLLIDSCFGGGIGEPVANRPPSTGWDIPNLYLREGITILAATKPNDVAIEIDGRGVFTRLLLGALKGGAADVRGWVSAASTYAYIEQALGPWQQRPIYKSHATQLSPLRYCAPDIDDADLRQLPHLFPTPDHQYTLDPSYEITSPEALPEHVQVFRLLKRFQVARLVRPAFAFDADLYFVAIRSHGVELTPLGQFYWQLAKENRIGGSPFFPLSVRSIMAIPDAESVAKLFHETYERLAPYYNYESRKETRVPWEQVPEQSKRLMIAVTTEVLSMLFPLQTTAEVDTTDQQ
jgi:uncharacterized caspase-like protein